MVISLSEVFLYFFDRGVFELTCACDCAFSGFGGRHGRNDGGSSSSESLAIGIMLALYYHYSVTYGVKGKRQKD